MAVALGVVGGTPAGLERLNATLGGRVSGVGAEAQRS